MELKAEDLRLKSIVDYNGSPLTVWSIKSPYPDKNERYSGKYILEIGSPDSFNVPIDECRSIVLTEELLLKLNHTKIVHNESNVEYTLNRFSIWFIEGKLQVIKFGIQRLDHTIINTLHKYQSVFYDLTSEDLTLK